MKKILIQYTLPTILVTFLVLQINSTPFAGSPPMSLQPTENDNMPDTLEFLPPMTYQFQDGNSQMNPLYAPNLFTGKIRTENFNIKIPPDTYALLYATSKIDQYGNPKIYAACTGTEKYNAREYPPLYDGDVFPVLDQLYYYEASIGERGKRGIAYRPHRAIKVLEAKYHNISSTILPEGQMILPLTPLDVVPNEDPMNYRSQMICRSSSLTMNTGAVSLVKIRQIMRTDWEIQKAKEEWERIMAQTKFAEPLPPHYLSVPPNYTAAIYTGNSGKGGGHPDMGTYVDAFQTVKEYKVGDILVCHYKDPEKSSTEDTPELAVGFKITKIVPPDPERNRVFQTVEGEKTGRLIGWVELDPTPIPVDANDKPVN